MTTAKTSTSEQPFTFNFTPPYSTFQEGKPIDIPYVIDGLFTQGGLSVLGGKAKQGKSSLSRYAAVCIAKDIPFLGRKTIQGETILFNLEDPLNHVDNCLHALDYDVEKDGYIHILNRLAPTFQQNLDALGDALTRLPHVRFVVIDTLAKFIRVKDMNEYMPVMTAVEQLHNIARKFTHLHILGLAHTKKLKTEDPFDALLGSTALRSEPDTNLAIFEEKGNRIITTETRIGRPFQPTILNANLVDVSGATVVKDFSLGTSLEELNKTIKEKGETKRGLSYEERIITYLSNREGQSASQEITLDEVQGRRTSKLEAIDALIKEGVVTVTGKKHSPQYPLILHLDNQVLPMYDMSNRFGGRS